MSFMNLDQGSQIIIFFDLILTSLEASSIFSGSLGSSLLLNRTTIDKFSLPESVKHSVSCARFKLTVELCYNARELIGSRIIELAAQCNQKLLSLLYLNGTRR